jgi:hypothetical protein
MTEPWRLERIIIVRDQLSTAEPNFGGNSYFFLDKFSMISIFFKNITSRLYFIFASLICEQALVKFFFKD